MEVLALLILVLFSLAGFAAVFFTTFGTLIIFSGAVIFSFLTGFEALDLSSLLILLTLYCAGEVSEYFCIILGAKKMGASNASVAGAIIGGILGAVLGTVFFGIGVFLSTVLGIFFGAFSLEFILQRDLKRSLKAGAGSVLGRLGSVAVKVIIALAMLVFVSVRIINQG